MVKINAPGYARNVYGQETQSYRAPQRNRLLDHSCDGSNRLVKNIGSTQPEISASGPQMAMATGYREAVHRFVVSAQVVTAKGP